MSPRTVWDDADKPQRRGRGISGIAGIPQLTESCPQVEVKIALDRSIRPILGSSFHLMKVIMNLSDRIVVLHYGKKLCEGTPEHVANNPEVIEAYLGVKVNA